MTHRARTEHSACGLDDNWLFLDLVRRPDVSAWRESNGLHLGDGERESEHWLILDTLNGEMYAAG
ncbi:hypothetical protein J0H58_23090 [bacterium]|nr:hypothetical protein [bacterium]